MNYGKIDKIYGKMKINSVKINICSQLTANLTDSTG